MKRNPNETPRIGRKDQQDPDRGTSEPREGVMDADAERSDRETDDERDHSRRPGSDSPRPAPAK
jgi:hypothetical protein